MRHEEITRQTLETTIRLGVVAVLAVYCYQIVRPFIHAVLWGIIIAIAVFPIYRRLRSSFGDRPKLAATAMTIALALIMVLPVVLLISLIADNLQVLAQQVRDGTLRVPPPPPDVGTWPIVGVPILKTWSLAAENLSAAVEQFAPQIKEIAGPLLGAAAAVGVSMVEFTVAVILAGVFLAYSEGGYRLSRAIGMRLAGPQGVELVGLAEDTMRSVARGVLGVAFIQAFMAGLGMVIVGVPFAGLWTFVAFLLAVVQVGVGLVVLPASIYVFSTQDNVTATLFLIWAVITTFTDNVLHRRDRRHDGRRYYRFVRRSDVAGIGLQGVPGLVGFGSKRDAKTNTTGCFELVMRVFPRKESLQNVLLTKSSGSGIDGSNV